MGMAQPNFVGISCVRCGSRQPVISPSPICRRCGGRLEVVMDLEEVKQRVSRESIERSRNRGVWKYTDLLPLMNPRDIVSLGEGNTNLSRSESLAHILGLRRLYLKDETTNPSGAFLDRGVTVEVSRAKSLGYRGASCGWSGNLASSLAAYCARGGMHARAHLPGQIDLGKLYQAVVYGAEIVPCHTKDEAFTRLMDQQKEFYPITAHSPFFLEGIKTSGIEVVDQLDWALPDWIVVPMGNGTHISMMYKGLKSLESIGLVDSVSTRLVGVQVEGCSPIADAFKGRPSGARKKNPDVTFARDIAVESPGMADEAIEALRSSGGDAVTVSEKEILDAVRNLAMNEGIFAEPAAASTIAALRRMLDSKVISRSESVVCMITGIGLKDPSMARKLASRNRVARNIISRFEETPFTRRIGDTKLAILKMLHGGESYAYAIRKKLAEDGKSISLVSVFQHLSELNDMDLITVDRHERSPERRVRVYYVLTERGHDVLSSLRADKRP